MFLALEDGGPCSWSKKMEILVLGRGGSWSRGRRATYWSGANWVETKNNKISSKSLKDGKAQVKQEC